MNVTAPRVLIVGCGNIAGGFDSNRSTNAPPLTHAGAYMHDGRFTITACVDPDITRRQAFMSTWDIPNGFCLIDDVLASHQTFDVISICSPTVCHAHDLDIARHLQPQLVFCEKPVTSSVQETARLVSAYHSINIPLAVNYTRRWDPEISNLKTAIQAEQWGPIRSIVGFYNKGILNNGSHMLDLLNLLVGPLGILTVGKPIYDFYDNDPTLPVCLETQTGIPVHMVPGHAQDYALFELQFVFSKGVLSMENGGLFWRTRLADDSPQFQGYRMLETDKKTSGAYPSAMGRAIDNIYQWITEPGNVLLASTGETALEAQKLCEQIKQQAPT